MDKFVRKLWAVLTVFWGLSSCNYDVGPCWFRYPCTEDADADPPAACPGEDSCPCIEQCSSTYNDVAASCIQAEQEAQCSACRNDAYATYETCLEGCLSKDGDCAER